MANGYVSQVQLPNNEIYDIKDKNAVKNITSSDIPGNINFTKGEETKDILVKDFGTAYGIDCYKGKLPLDFTSPSGAIDEWKIYGNSSGPAEVIETQSTLPVSIDTYGGDAVDWEIYGNNNPVIETESSTLPIDISSSGGNAIDYTIYGNDENGTENLFDIPDITSTGYNTYYASGVPSADVMTTITSYLSQHIDEEFSWYIDIDTTYTGSYYFSIVLFYSDGTYQVFQTTRHFTPSKTVLKIELRVVYNNAEGIGLRYTFKNITIIKGSTAPDHYIPYQKGVGENTEITGKLSIDFRSNGDDLLGYRIYGTVDGAGVQTENLFNKNATDTANGYVDGEHLKSNGATNSNSLWAITEYIPIAGGYNYTFNYGPSSSSPAICYYDSSKQFIQGVSYGGQNPKVVSIPSNVSYIRFSFMKSYADAIMFVQASSLPETYIPYGYKFPLKLTSGVESKDTDIYIGDSKLLAGDYIDYESSKIYKAKRIHEDTVTIDGIVWDILDYDHDEVYKADGTRAKHTVTIQTHDIINALQYSARQAVFAFPNGLAAGTYHFTVGAHPWVAGDVGKVLTFTLANAIAAGGQLFFNGAYDSTLVGKTISVFASPTSTTAAETVTMIEGNTGTDLGTILRSKTDAINSIDRALLGSNNWLENAMRQYLNSDKAAGSVWTPQSVFDRPPTWASATAGFLNGKSADFLSHIGTAKKKTGLNSISDGGETAVHDEKFFLLSRSEVYMGDEYTGGEDTPYAYYKNYSDNQSASTSADKNRIKYRAGVAKNWWLRSPRASGAHGVSLVTTSGAQYNHAATYDNGVAPACCIVLDDMDDWVKQTFYTEVDADLPAIETFKGKNTLDSTETLGETMITQGYRIPLQIKQGATTRITDIYIGNSPLTQGQTITKSQSNVDLELFSGDNIIDTSLYNKPNTSITYNSSVLGVGENTEITGELPIDFRSNGDDLLGYRIYGTADGAGAQTGNLFDKDARDTENGFISGAFINQDGSISLNNNYIVSEYIPIEVSRPYFITVFSNNIPHNPAFVLYDENKEIIQGEKYNSRKSILISENYTLQARYIRLSVATAGPFQADSATTLTKGSIPPSIYIPYGYKLPLTVTSGADSKTADVYIGDSKLMAGDYIDYESGKIVRNGTPQDPPLPFPALETFKGENTLDSTETLGETTITPGYRIPLQIKQGTTTKTVDFYIGSTPLTEGQSISKTSTGTEIALYQGENTISTTLGNKPEMKIDYLSTEVGVGERTENLFNVDIVQGYYNTSNGVFNPNSVRYVASDKVSIIGGQMYTLSFDCDKQASSATSADGFIYFWNNDLYMGGTQVRNKELCTFTAPSDANTVAFIVGAGLGGKLIPSDVTNIMLVKGSTAPTTYIPYGYQIPIDIKQGDKVVDHKDIYIGTQPLIEGDYINQTGVYRRLHQLINYASSSSLPNYNFIPITEQLIAENGENTITTSLVNNTTIDVELHPTKHASWICDRLEDLQRRIDNVDSTLGAPERRNYLVTWCSEDRLTGSTANLDFSFNNKDSGYSTFLIDGKSTATSAFIETINLLKMINGTARAGAYNYTVARPGKYVVVIFGVEMEDSSSNTITLKIIRDNAVIASQQLINEYVGCIPFEIPNDLYGNNTIIQIEVNSTTGWTDLSFGVGIAVLNATMLLQDSNLKTDTMAIGNFSMYDSYVQLLHSHRNLEDKCTILENKCTVLENEYDQLANESVKDIIVYSDYTSTIPSGLNIDISQYKNKIKYVDIYFTDNNYRKGEVYPYNILAENFGYLRIPYGQIYTGSSADEATRLSLSLIGDENSYYIRRELFYISTDYEQEHLFFTQYRSVPGLILQFVGTPTNDWSNFSVKGKSSEVIKIYEVHLIVSP